MSKLIMSGLALWVCAVRAAGAEPVLPMAEGSTWEYEVAGAGERGAPPTIKIVRIGGHEEVNGKVLLKLETLAGSEIVETELISVTNRGVLCHERTWRDGKSVRFDPPQTVVPALLKAGAKWELDDTVAGSSMHQKWSVGAEEEVEVPAGKFKAYRFQSEQPWPVSIRIDRWFVPGTGFVKDITTTRGPTGRLLSRLTTSLRQFSVVPIPEIKSGPAPSVPIASLTPSAAPSQTPAGMTAPPLPPSRAVTPAFASEPPALRVKLEISATREGVGATEFPSDVPNIFVQWSGENLPVNSMVRVAWIAEDVGDVAPPNFIIDQTETLVTNASSSARFTLSRPRDGWAAGKYRVELYLEEALIDTVKVTIRD